MFYLHSGPDAWEDVAVCVLEYPKERNEQKAPSVVPGCLEPPDIDPSSLRLPSSQGLLLSLSLSRTKLTYNSDRPAYERVIDDCPLSWRVFTLSPITCSRHLCRWIHAGGVPRWRGKLDVLISPDRTEVMDFSTSSDAKLRRVVRGVRDRSMRL